MVEELANYLKECDIEVVAVKNLLLPATTEGKHNILVVPGYNLVEMMEEVQDEEDSLSAYVHTQLEEVQRLSVEDAFRKIAESQLVYTDLSPEQKSLEGKDFEDIYRAYALLWEGNELMNEQHCETKTMPFAFHTGWVERKMGEDEELIVLTLPLEAGYEAPLWVPMGGFNECPLPVYQSVIFRHFQESYGVTLLAVSDDTWILQTGRRPQTYEEALTLAKEHFIFCQYVLEDQPTIGHYVDYLMKNDVWYFWWD
ncbi:DUF4253 domain-containing protein [Brevibacillus sp. NRS-1366]|uniref:DUF4253 domain-containing protein n=1 Tax=Brevibacillus sp. NRS-1366 TaxID=3233899 RepID=UPI003D1E5059